MVTAIASATAIADTVKHEHTELSERIDWTDSQCDDLKVNLAAQVEAGSLKHIPLRQHAGARCNDASLLEFLNEARMNQPPRRRLVEFFKGRMLDQDLAKSWRTWTSL